jgi:hypothetical protein
MSAYTDSNYWTRGKYCRGIVYGFQLPVFFTDDDDETEQDCG